MSMFKLSARKNIVSSIPTDSPSSSSAAVTNDIGSGSGGFAGSSLDVAKHEGMKKEIDELRAVNEALIMEKKYWMTRLTDDNAKLAVMFKSLQEVKSKLLAEIDDVQKEKDKLKYLQISFAEKCVDALLRESLLTEEKRVLLPPTQRSRAEEIYNNLVALTQKCRANQYELLSYVSRKISHVEKSFLESHEEECEKALTQFKNVASGQPGNVLSAEALAKSLPDAIVTALVQSSADKLANRYLEARLRVDADGGHSSASSIKSLQQENDSLKSVVESMRKQMTKLRAAKMSESASALLTSSSSSLPSTPSAAAASSAARSRGGDGNSTSYLSERAFDSLPAPLTRMAMDIIQNIVRELLDNHPLAGRLTGKVRVEITAEIALQTKALVGSQLAAMFTKGEVYEDFDCLDSALNRLLQSAALYQELAAQITMTLAYLHARGLCGSDADAREQTPSSSSLSLSSSSAPLSAAYSPAGSSYSVAARRSPSSSSSSFRQEPPSPQQQQQARTVSFSPSPAKQAPSQTTSLRPRDPQEKPLPRFMRTEGYKIKSIK